MAFAKKLFLPRAKWIPTPWKQDIWPLLSPRKGQILLPKSALQMRSSARLLSGALFFGFLYAEKFLHGLLN